MTISQREGTLSKLWSFLARVNMLIYYVPSESITNKLKEDASQNIKDFMVTVSTYVSESQRAAPNENMIQGLVDAFKSYVANDSNFHKRVSVYFEYLSARYGVREPFIESGLVSAQAHIDWLLTEFKAEIQDVSEDSVQFVVLERNVSVSRKMNSLIFESLNWSSPQVLRPSELLKREMQREFILEKNRTTLDCLVSSSRRAKG